MNGDGYVHVAKIPAGATNIELREHSNNYVGAHLRSLTYTAFHVVFLSSF